MQDTHALSTICSGFGSRSQANSIFCSSPIVWYKVPVSWPQFPKRKGRCSKEQMRGRARALGPSHRLVLCGGGPSCLHSGLQYRTLQAVKAQILSKMAVEEPDWRPEWCSELRADPSLHRNRQAVGVNRWAPLPKPEGQGLHQAWMLRSERFRKETTEFKWISLKLVLKDESEYMIETRRPVSALLTGRILNGLKLIG